MLFSVLAFKKRSVLLLMAIALSGRVPAVCSGRSVGEPSEPANTTLPSDSNQLQAHESRGAATLRDKPDSETVFDFDPGSGTYSTLVRAVLFVAILGAAAVYVSKKLLPKITNLPGKEVRVVETVYLGPRKAVHVLEVGGRRLLVASTNENITKLADITGDFVDLSVPEAGCN